MFSSLLRAASIAACAVPFVAPAAVSHAAGRASHAAAATAPGALAGIPLSSLSQDAGEARALPAGPVLLQFWASWCGSCGKLMWDLDGLAAAHPQVAYRAVSIDAQRSDALRVRSSPLFARHPDRYLQDATGELARRLAVQAVPTLVVLDRAGTERWRHVGHVNSADLQQLRRTLADLLPDSMPDQEPRP